jgi:hypothetical protein
MVKGELNKLRIMYDMESITRQKRIALTQHIFHIADSKYDGSIFPELLDLDLMDRDLQTKKRPATLPVLVRQYNVLAASHPKIIQNVLVALQALANASFEGAENVDEDLEASVAGPTAL